jgi:hypothetical protein
LLASASGRRHGTLRDALLAHARTAGIVSTIETEFGMKYILEGPLVVPGGYEVEFVTLTGETVSVVMVFARAVRPVAPKEIAHARLVA